LRNENADLVAQLEAAREPAVANGADRLEATLPIGPAAPARARAALTRWLSGNVPHEVLENAHLLASELVTNSLGHAELSADDSLRIAVQLTPGALRV
jgi:anti-sigma regulatory factor (Ser/Thr protein kinase)